jgi:hypothetical protein
MKFNFTTKTLSLTNHYVYQPSNFYKALYDSNPNAKKAWKIICHEISIIKMITVTDVCKKSALLALDEDFYNDEDMKKEIKSESFRKMCGEMAKQVMEIRGYRTKNKPKINGKYFKTATKYEKK